jgi:hypothetical protein
MFFELEVLIPVVTEAHGEGIKTYDPGVLGASSIPLTEANQPG